MFLHDCPRAALDCRVESESFDWVLARLIEIAEKKAKNPQVDKVPAAQWAGPRAGLLGCASGAQSSARVPAAGKVALLCSCVLFRFYAFAFCGGI